MPADLEAVMPSYNSASTIQLALRSATVDNAIPVIVVDDGSADDTVRIAARESRVRVLQQRHGGPSVARNRGILESSADFLLFLDSDDLLLPGYREQFERALAAEPTADVFVCGMEVRDDDGRRVSVHPAPGIEPTPFASVLAGSPVPTNGVVVRRCVLARTGLFRPGLDYAEDLDLWLRLAVATDRWVRMGAPLAVYRMRAGSLSKDAPRMWRGIRDVVDHAARLPVAPWPTRASARRRALSQAAHYVFLSGYAERLRAARQDSAGHLLRELWHLPGRLWPVVLAHAVRSACRSFSQGGAQA